MKPRLCSHGNRDKDKDGIRKDSSTAQFDIIRLIASITASLNLSLASIDIKGAYLQSGPIKRDIYIRPPRECFTKRGTLWKLTKLPYGIVEAGRQWATVFEEWLISSAKLQRVNGFSQLYIKQNAAGLSVAKVTDDLLLARTESEIHSFSEQVSTRFSTRKTIIGEPILFNGCSIVKDEQGSVTVSMQQYLDDVTYLAVCKLRRKELEKLVTPHELTDFKRLCGELIWLGCSVLPQAAFMASFLQQQLPHLKVKHLVEANSMLRHLKTLRASIRYLRPPSSTDIIVKTYSDAARNVSKHMSYVQTGLITTLVFQNCQVMHPIDWSSCKQKRVCYSSYGAEILTCTDADDRGFYVKNACQAIYFDRMITHQVVVDSKGLFDTLTTLHEGKDYRLRQTVQRIRDSFDSGEMDSLMWVKGKVNIADVLTKHNPVMHRLLNRAMVSGIYDVSNFQSFQLDSATWK